MYGNLCDIMYRHNFFFYNSMHPTHKYVYHPPENNQLFFINTPGCKMPSFPVHDDFVGKFLQKMNQIQCKKEPPITESDYNFLWINLTEIDLRKFYSVINLDGLVCYYRSFRRLDNNHVNYYGPAKTLIKYGERLKITSEYINVNCSYYDKHIYTDYHFFVHKMDIKPQKVFQSQNVSCEHDDRYNVVIIGFDSVSRLNFQRQLTKSYDTIMNRLKGFEFSGYNKLADNTYPNLIPTLTGRTQDELDGDCLPIPSTTPYDNCSSIIWNKFKLNNYYTVYSEDAEYLGLFAFLRGGFHVQPTDFYTRTLFREMEQRIAHNHIINIDMCLGYHRPIDYFFKYIDSSMLALKDSPYFSFFWSTTVTHDDFSRTETIDNDFNRLLVNLDEKQLLNKTVLILMSDHGIRFGDFRNTYQGMMEERQPYLFIVVPKEFRQKYPQAVENLRVNKKRLTTHFDLHETLKDLANSTMFTGKVLNVRHAKLMNTTKIPRGISLFVPIPDTRTCDEAGITPHWCTCHEKESIALDDINVVRAATFMINRINYNLTEFTQCQPLLLLRISEAVLLKTNNFVTKSLESDKIFDITVHIVTEPGNGAFEGTMRLTSNSEEIFLTGISRTNLYGHHSDCVDDVEIKLYCFCKIINEEGKKI